MIPKEEIEKVLRIKGHINGMGFAEDKKFILETLGEKEPKKIEAKISEITGEKFSYDQFKPYVMYPLYLSVLTTLILKYDYKFSDDDIKRFGREGAKVSLVVKLFLSNFVSLKKVLKYGERLWKKYFNTGRLFVDLLDEEKHEMIIKITEFDTHPIYCLQIEGVIYQLISYIIKSNKIEVKEIECVFKGGKSHRFKITW